MGMWDDKMTRRRRDQARQRGDAERTPEPPKKIVAVHGTVIMEDGSTATFSQYNPNGLSIAVQPQEG